MFFDTKSVGLDIADRSIEAVELVYKNGRIQLASVGRVHLAPGIVVQGRINNTEKLAQAVREVFLTAKPHAMMGNKVYFGLPEAHTYITLLAIAQKDISGIAMDRLVHEEAFKTIPLAHEDTILAHAIRFQDAKTSEVVAVGVLREVIYEWEHFFASLKIKVASYDCEIFALARGLFYGYPKKQTCIVDMGTLTSMIAVFDERGLVYVYSTRIGGDLLTRNLAADMEMTYEEAELAKRKYGFLHEDEQVKNSMAQTLGALVQEIQHSLEYVERKFNKKVEDIILVGGTSKLKNGAEFFAEKLGRPVLLGKSKVLEAEHFPRNRQRVYVEATGLALRGFGKKLYTADPVILVEHDSADQRRHLLAENNMSEKFSKDENGKDRARTSVLFAASLMLFAITLALLGGFFFWYRVRKVPLAKESAQEIQDSFTQKQSLFLTVALAVDESEYTPDRIAGRIIADHLASGESYSAGVSASRKMVLLQLKKGELLWQDPLTPPQKNFPMVLSWLAYSSADAERLFRSELEKVNSSAGTYELLDIIPGAVVPSENEKIMRMQATVIFRTL